jgi:two-component system LytT family sensor kinase
VLHEPRFLSAEQYLLVTLIVQLAGIAALATMLVRFRRFRTLLLTERRDWPERLKFMGALGVPLAAGVASRLLLGYAAADVSLGGAYLAGLVAGPYAGAIMGAMMGLPAVSGSPCPCSSAAASRAVVFAKSAPRTPSGTSRPSC